MKIVLTLLTFFLLAGCSHTTMYPLASLPFNVEIPNSYGYTESETAYFFSSQGGPAIFYFEKTPEERAFFELFEDGYEEWTDKSSGVWVICEKEDWSNCYVQNLHFPELYPLHVQTDLRETLSEEDREEISTVLMHIRKD